MNFYICISNRSLEIKYFLPIKRSAWDLLMFTNSCWRNCRRFCFEVSAISRLIRSRSTADGWYFVSRGIGGIISVLRAKFMATFLLQKILRQNQIIYPQDNKQKTVVYDWQWETERILWWIWWKPKYKLGIGCNNSHLTHVVENFGLQKPRNN